MINTLITHIKYGVGLIKHSVRDIRIKTKRSSKWSALEKSFKKQFPTCACCRTNKKVQIHHIVPFHVSPELELEPTNLISLCMSKRMCHLQIAHCGSFRKWTENIRQYASILSKDISKYNEIVKLSKESAKT